MEENNTSTVYPNWYIDDKAEAIAATAVSLVAVLAPLNAAVVALSAQRFPAPTQQKVIAEMARVVSALYSVVPDRYMDRVQALVDKELFPTTEPFEGHPSEVE